jgi:hypothetical protein
MMIAGQVTPNEGPAARSAGDTARNTPGGASGARRRNTIPLQSAQSVLKRFPSIPTAHPLDETAAKTVPDNRGPAP